MHRGSNSSLSFLSHLDAYNFSNIALVSNVYNGTCSLQVPCSTRRRARRETQHWTTFCKKGDGITSDRQLKPSKSFPFQDNTPVLSRVSNTTTPLETPKIFAALGATPLQEWVDIHCYTRRLDTEELKPLLQLLVLLMSNSQVVEARDTNIVSSCEISTIVL